ncbi:MAG: hypothetical protein ACI9FR_000345 [Cryomorphaceae bacterium]|jgi:uncharacterized protein (DUF58 family)
MNIETKQATLDQLSSHGVVTDLARLLKSRYWAQGLSLFSPLAARNMTLGNVRSRFRGRGMEFEEVRRYQPGDDIRTIDWKVSARADGTYTKLFCEERERPCHIMVDQRSHLFFGSNTRFKSVLAAELAAALCWSALAGGDRVGGQVLGNLLSRDTRARRSKQAALGFIHDLHELNTELADISDKQDSEPPVGATNLATSLEECRRITRPGTAIFIISDFHDFDQAAAKALRNLAKNTDISLFQVSDALEEKLPISGNVSISDGQHSSRVRVSKRVQADYLEQRQQRQLDLKSSANRARAPLIKVDTAESVRSTLNKLFSR